MSRTDKPKVDRPTRGLTPCWARLASCEEDVQIWISRVLEVGSDGCELGEVVEKLKIVFDFRVCRGGNESWKDGNY